MAKHAHPSSDDDIWKPQRHSIWDLDQEKVQDKPGSTDEPQSTGPILGKHATARHASPNDTADRTSRHDREARKADSPESVADTETRASDDPAQNSDENDDFAQLAASGAEQAQEADGAHGGPEASVVESDDHNADDQTDEGAGEAGTHATKKTRNLGRSIKESGLAGKMLAAICAASMVVVLFCSGFILCALPPTTWILSNATSNFTGSQYTHDELVKCALATRDFTVNPYFDGELAAAEQLADTVVQAARTSAESSEKFTHKLQTAVTRVNAIEDSTQLHAMFVLVDESDAFGLDLDAIDHLMDCNKLINATMPWVIASFVICGLSVGALLKLRKEKLLGLALRSSVVFIGTFLALCAAYALIDFNGFFSMFHAILFPQGNWTFSAQSLLITMYPQGFWIGMGGIWLVTSAAACIIAFILGARLIKERAGEEKEHHA